MKFESIYQAIDGNDFAAVKEFVGNGIDLDKSGKRGFTPLHWAAMRGSLEIVQFLKGAGRRNYAIIE